MREIYGRAEHEAVALLCLFCKFVGYIAEHALARRFAFAAGNAVGIGFVADKKHLGIHALFAQGARNLAQGDRSAAVAARTADSRVLKG